jgi:hypothetical protein
MSTPIKSITGEILFEREGTVKVVLEEAMKKGADLWEAHLRGAYLRGANLQGAYLQRAVLQEAVLWGADLQEAHLQGADLWGAYYDISMVLKAYWLNPSEESCLELMRLDCELLPDGEVKFQQWVEKRTCPFNGKLSRGYYFPERRDLWKSGRPKPMVEIWGMLCKEHDIKWDGVEEEAREP